MGKQKRKNNVQFHFYSVIFMKIPFKIVISKIYNFILAQNIIACACTYFDRITEYRVVTKPSHLKLHLLLNIFTEIIFVVI